MAAACSTSQPATTNSWDARWRAFLQPASFQRWRRSPGHSALVHKALIERRSVAKVNEPYAVRATGLRRTRIARSPDVASRLNDVLLRGNTRSPPDVRDRLKQEHTESAKRQPYHFCVGQNLRPPHVTIFGTDPFLAISLQF